MHAKWIDSCSVRGLIAELEKMGLYELLVISKSGPQSSMAQLKGVMRSTSEMLLDAKSVIRKIEFLGHRKLPYRMKHQEAYHYEGSYWLVHFYGSPLINETLKEKLRFDPEIIRYSLLKRADTLKHLIR